MASTEGERSGMPKLLVRATVLREFTVSELVDADDVFPYPDVMKAVAAAIAKAMETWGHGDTPPYEVCVRVISAAG